MICSRHRPSVVPLLGAAALVAALTGCGSSPDRDALAAGARPAAGASASAPSATSVSSSEPDPGASPVAGLTPEQLRAAVDAAGSSVARSAQGPVAEVVPLVGGGQAWRVRIPGRFPVRAVRATVAVAGRDLGPGLVAPGLGALVAITTDPSLLRPGAEVTYRWGDGRPVSAGVLEVAR